jgi:acyl carrier protein
MMTVSNSDEKISQLEASVTEELSAVLRGLPADFNAKTPLMSSGLLDSFAALELVQRVEAKLKISLKDDDLTPENFETVKSLAQLLARY